MRKNHRTPKSCGFIDDQSRIYNYGTLLETIIPRHTTKVKKKQAKIVDLSLQGLSFSKNDW